MQVTTELEYQWKGCIKNNGHRVEQLAVDIRGASESESLSDM